jgi:hypothetical protein
MGLTWRPSAGALAHAVPTRAAAGVLSNQVRRRRSEIQATLVPIRPDGPSRQVSASWTRVISISPRSTPDARESNEGQVLPPEVFVVVVVVVVVVNPGRVGAWLALGRAAGGGGGGCSGAIVGATRRAACCSSGHRDTQWPSCLHS